MTERLTMYSIQRLMSLEEHSSMQCIRGSEPKTENEVSHDDHAVYWKPPAGAGSRSATTKEPPAAKIKSSSQDSGCNGVRKRFVVLLNRMMGSKIWLYMLTITLYSTLRMWSCGAGDVPSTDRLNFWEVCTVIERATSGAAATSSSSAPQQHRQ